MSNSNKSPITVLKFGSSVLRSEADLPRVVHEIYAELRRGQRVLAVVSALGSTTDELLARARAQSPVPEPRHLAQLLATGESTAAALLSLALERAGVPTSPLSPLSIGLVSEGGHLDAHPVRLDTAALLAEFEKAPVLVLPGFVSHRADGDLALLGRGGSDLTAIFVAGKLQESGTSTRCALVKDVDALYEWDPAGQQAGEPRRFEFINYRDALELSGDVVQHKAVHVARDLGLTFEVGSCSSLALLPDNPTRLSATCDLPTVVGPETSRLGKPENSGFTPLRIALIGHGTVGAGVLDLLRASPDDFDVVGVLVRDPARHAHLNFSRFEELFTQDANAFFARPFDVLVELAGGIDSPREWIARALSTGAHVVTANKALLSGAGFRLQKQAAAAGQEFAFSAAVGGSVPLLEAARRLRHSTVQRFEAVLNGTSNFVLDALAEGLALDEALQRARDAGYAEADPRLDLDGTDAAQKLGLLARALFGPGVRIHWDARAGIEDLPTQLFEEAKASGGVVRSVARCTRDVTEAGVESSVRLSVTPVVLDAQHPLADVRGASCGAVFFSGHESQTIECLSGAGAGRWPTAEAVYGDLLELRRRLVRTTPTTRAGR